jgi:hypothetical protein
MVHGQGYTGLRRKPWYPRRKQPRAIAKLGRAHRVILREVYRWEWVLTDWLKEHRFALEYDAVQAQLADGMTWQPRTFPPPTGAALDAGHGRDGLTGDAPPGAAGVGRGHPLCRLAADARGAVDGPGARGGETAGGEARRGGAHPRGDPPGAEDDCESVNISREKLTISTWRWER